ncbi:MAG: hypothetical protein ACRELD_12145 [Longimicrobiales bacterium]
MHRSKSILVAAVLLAPGCGDSTAPEAEAVPESQLEFVRFPADLQPLVTRQGSVWAVKGESSELVLRYQAEPGEDEGEEFLEFDIPGNALLRRPDGTLFQRGDSVLITVTVDDGGRFLFHFEPSGLVFDPDHAPELEITYRRVGGDLNGDGTVDDDDDDLEDRMSLWRQERPGLPWFRIGTVKFEDLDEVEAEIFSFTGFAIAA